MQRLSASIYRSKVSLKETEPNFYEDRDLRASISSRIDCKLPTIVAGHILREIGWNVHLASFNHPEHPFLFASASYSDGSENTYAIGFNSTLSRFKSDPTITSIGDAHISASKKLAIGLGFISDNNPWPLPFNEESFQKYDDWFIRMRGSVDK